MRVSAAIFTLTVCEMCNRWNYPCQQCNSYLSSMTTTFC
ncbi:unnamed protein product [Musa acuminata subsp. malaccensis]|uniref:(wild Malaysian banana) hypothetical protein n=1 Tax=Musa acuminata subsp. malaccensis TaxID=214687 RepID=A0A804KNN4_MUSAM|nr:unnamed protein product [Musa acuminata subsp. malaccensis]